MFGTVLIIIIIIVGTVFIYVNVFMLCISTFIYSFIHVFIKYYNSLFQNNTACIFDAMNKL